MVIDLNADHGKAMIEERIDRFKGNVATTLRFKLHIHVMSDDTVAHLNFIRKEQTIMNKMHPNVLLKFGKRFDDNNLKILKEALNDKKYRLLEGKKFVCSVAKANNLYNVLDSLDGREILSLDCYESHVTLLNLSHSPDIKKLRIRLKGANAPVKEFPDNLEPIAKELIILNIDQSAAIRWD